MTVTGAPTRTRTRRPRAVPVRRRPPSPPTCINLISHREDVVLRGRDAVMRAANQLSEILG